MGLRKWAIAALLVLVTLGLAAPATAWIGQKVGVHIDDVYFGWETVIQKPSATLFHTQNLATTDTEALAIAFPTQAGSFVFPAIAQTSADTSAASETGFFKANWCYTALSNLGGYDLGPDVSTWHPMKSSQMVGSGISWPYMNNAPAGSTTMKFQPSVDMAPDVKYNGDSVSVSPANTTVGSGTIGGMNLSAANTTQGNNVTAAKSTATPNRDYKNMTKDNIKAMSGLEKMYRNANLRNTVPQAFKGGTVDNPTVIDPLKNPRDIIKAPDYPKVIKDSLAMTQTGTHLKTMFWDL